MRPVAGMRMVLALILLLTLACALPAGAGEDPLPSWRDGAARAALLEFVASVTDAAGPAWVPPEERIATFDNDGTLWAEQPLYVQAIFAMDRVRDMAAGHPEWKAQEPFAAVLRGDTAAALAGGEHSLLQLVMASHTGMTVDAFQQIVLDWIGRARHPTTGRPYTEMVYQPMLELLDFLRDNGFHIYIVSGGGIEFMRPWVERVYGVPPEQVIGSSIVTRYEVRDGRPQLVRLAEVNFIDDKAGKPVGINQHIGRRPILAVGNSDGDFQMLEWTTAEPGARLGVLLHHTDAEREWAYDRESPVGRLARGLDEAAGRGWVVVDMKRDWERVFP